MFCRFGSSRDSIKTLDREVFARRADSQGLMMDPNLMETQQIQTKTENLTVSGSNKDSMARFLRKQVTRSRAIA